MPADPPALPRWSARQLPETDMVNDERWLSSIHLRRAQTALRVAQAEEQQARVQFESRACSFEDLRAAMRRAFELERDLESCTADHESACRRYRNERASYVRRTGERSAELILRGPMEISGGNPSTWTC